MTRVDIIVPVYNVEPFLGRCLDSLIGQTYTGWRAICVDDGSTDRCPEILKNYASRDSRFVVITKANGGLSEARNIGLDAAESEFVMFVDSDDFIHPQTLEIALALADRDGSDVVTWYRASYYRNVQVRLLRAFGNDDVHTEPWDFGKRHSLDTVRSVVTDNLMSMCSEWMHHNDDFAVKHCYVWRHLFRREVVADVRFQPGLLFEDVPWWSEVLLKPLRATIADLRLYYYYPNRRSIVKTAGRSRKTHQMLTGLLYTYRLYKEKATPEQMTLWSHNIKWAILYHISGRIRSVNLDDTCGKEIRSMLSELCSAGCCEDCATRRERYAARIILSSCR